MLVVQPQIWIQYTTNLIDWIKLVFPEPGWPMILSLVLLPWLAPVLRTFCIKLRTFSLLSKYSKFSELKFFIRRGRTFGILWYTILRIMLEIRSSPFKAFSNDSATWILINFWRKSFSSSLSFPIKMSNVPSLGAILVFLYINLFISVKCIFRPDQ